MLLSSLATSKVHAILQETRSRDAVALRARLTAHDKSIL